MKREIVSVVGAGSWGKALATILSRKEREVRLWGRNLNSLQGLTFSPENGKNLADKTPADVQLYADIALALQNADWVVIALPSAAVVELAQVVSPLLEPQTRIASGTKGLHPQSGLRPSQLWEQAGVPLQRFVSFSGPNLAKEIVAGVPTSMVVASPEEETAREAQHLLAFPNLRVYRNTDLTGVELGGALKNVVAIAAGICDGLGFGDNTKAALVTRGWSEMTRLALTLGARQETLYGLSGMGDLIATCASTQSRNHSIGELLGKGFSLQDAQQKIGHVAEGVYTTIAALQLAQEQQLELPITWQLKKVLFEGYNAAEAVTKLMSRPERNEIE
jgi:glycerol-3-phosphate dehydrogenase (NAD(P)+)